METAGASLSWGSFLAWDQAWARGGLAAASLTSASFLPPCSDLLQNPLIVPVKVLKGHALAHNLGVLDVAFHPSQPWLFSAGADATLRLFT